MKDFGFYFIYLNTRCYSVLFMRFSQMFVYAGTMSATIALWLPNVIFAIIAAILYKKAPK